MRGCGSDVEGAIAAGVQVPPVVIRVAREIVRRKLLSFLSVTLAAIALVQGTILLVVARRPITRLYVSDTTWLEPLKVQKSYP
jgi:hypothetical protein